MVTFWLELLIVRLRKLIWVYMAKPDLMKSRVVSDSLKRPSLYLMILHTL
ncbi:hypothetical protein GLYMA_07G038350v4 [Glycine max]|nr:hypothetical protein GLYMA_07G038350v4 [Glycine max]KAH1085282.1 hypothetical protein GYH30_017327 [Glycine max]